MDVAILVGGGWYVQTTSRQNYPQLRSRYLPVKAYIQLHVIHCKRGKVLCGIETRIENGRYFGFENSHCIATISECYS